MYSRKTRWMRDERAEDGALIRGWRLVRNGAVKFDNRHFTHESLKEHEGTYIPITWAQFWQIDAVFERSRHESIKLKELEAITPTGATHD